MRLIDVDALKESFGDQRLDGDWCICGDETTARDLIDEATIIDAEPVRHGKWIGKPIAGYADIRCSECRSVFISQSGRWEYCSHCGAKMDLNG